MPYTNYNRPYGQLRKAALGAAVAAGRWAYANRGTSNSNRQLKRKYKRKPRKSTRKQPQPKTMKAKVAALTKKVNQGLATYVKKSVFTNNLELSTYAVVSYDTRSGSGTTVLEAVIDALRYFNPSTPGTVITANVTSGTYQKAVTFTSSYFGITCKNNYVVPCYVDMYIVMPKQDTSIEPTTAMSNSLTDESNATSASPLIFPTDCTQFNDLWKICKHSRRLLSPGAQASVSYADNKSFEYDPSFVDSETETYQRRFGGYSMFVRLEGVLAHDSVNGECSLSKAGVDIKYDRIHKVLYDAGIKTHYIETDENYQTITNTMQVTNLDTAQETYAL